MSGPGHRREGPDATSRPREDPLEENRLLRRTMRDLVALSSLPAAWAGLSPDRIARSLADVLMGILDLDLLYIRLSAPTGKREVEVVRSSRNPDGAGVEEVRAVIAPLLERDGVERGTTLSDPFGDGTLNVALTRFGVSDSGSLLVSGSRVQAFPTERDRLLLGVGANQTAIVVQRWQAEEAAHAGRERLDLALEAGDLGHWEWSLADRKATRNSRHDEIFGYASLLPEWTYEMFLAHVVPEDRAGVDAGFRNAVDSGEPWSFEARIRRADGEIRWIWATGRILRSSDEQDRRMAGIVVDITERKQVEEELREADRRKDEFLATLAHELRNPLAPIRNSLEMLKLPGLEPADARYATDVMERQIQHLVRLVDDLLDVSRVMRGKIELRKERVGLGQVVPRAIETVRPLIDEQRQKLEVSLPDEKLILEADPVRLAQVFGNLLTNASKYTEAGGHISLTAGRESDDVVLRVRDSGIGIPPDLLPHIFDSFVQGERAAERFPGGLGLGLTLARNLVELHGGAISAESAGEGQGTEFSVRLPLSFHERRDDETRERNGEQETGPTHRILVVDDHEDSATTLAALLEASGHEVQAVHDGLSALELAREWRPEFILLDIGMPKMDGYEVARRVRDLPELAGVILIALTGWGQDHDRRRSAEAGFDHHLVKPVEHKDLEAVLVELRRQEAGAETTDTI